MYGLVFKLIVSKNTSRMAGRGGVRQLELLRLARRRRETFLAPDRGRLSRREQGEAGELLLHREWLHSPSSMRTRFLMASLTGRARRVSEFPCLVRDQRVYTTCRGIVLRMLASYVGQERFMEGVSIYLKKYAYSNTVTRDLWECIQQATGSSG